MKIVRIYIRVSTEHQDLTRQENLIEQAKQQGYYIAGVYKEKASGTIINRPELIRLINDLQKGDVIIAEKMDRISRLPLEQAEKLIQSIKDKGAFLAIPGVINFSDFINDEDQITKIILKSIQEMLLKLTLQIARDDYELRQKRIKQGIEKAKLAGKYKGRIANKKLYKKIIIFKTNGYSIKKTAELANCSISHVKNIWSKYKNNKLQI